MIGTLRACFAAGAFLWANTAHSADISYDATVDRVVDGDSVVVLIKGWPEPFTPIEVRVYGIDSPESRSQDAKCVKELKLGLIAKQWARNALPSGSEVKVVWHGGKDKYMRLLASITMPDGKDFAAEQIKLGNARPYGLDGNLTKASWCK